MRIATGLAFALFGSLWLLYVFAHARMVDPALPADVRRVHIVERMFLQPGIAEGTFVGIVLVVCGLGLVAGQVWLSRRKMAEPGAAPDGRETA